MAMVSLGQAARLAGVGKTTMTRAIKAGKLSANRLEDGSYQIDVSELSRAYKIRVETPETTPETGFTVHHETVSPRPLATAETPDVTGRLAALDAEVKGLRELFGRGEGQPRPVARAGGAAGSVRTGGAAVLVAQVGGLDVDWSVGQLRGATLATSAVRSVRLHPPKITGFTPSVIGGERGDDKGPT